MAHQVRKFLSKQYRYTATNQESMGPAPVTAQALYMLYEMYPDVLLAITPNMPKMLLKLLHFWRLDAVIEI